MDLDRGSTVLIIEDDPDVGTVIKKSLETVASVFWLKNGLDIVNDLSEIKPDLILLGIHLGQLNGFDLFREIRKTKEGNDIPILFITSDTNPETEARGLELGAVDFILRPIRTDRLLMRIQIHLGLKKRKDEMKKTIEEQTKEIQLSQEGIISSLAVLAEFRDEETGKHIKRTRSYVEVLVRELKKRDYGGYSDADYDSIIESAILHDLGKIGIQDHILVKPGRLTPEEYESIKAHTLLGSQAIARTEKLCGSTPFLRFAREIAEYHHERWNGSGYPHGLKGEEIPLCARIMAIADVYDALITRRPYKSDMSHAMAVEEITEHSSGHFDPFLIQVFMDVQGTFQQIADRYSSE